jgi:hypothetical protein
MVSRFILVRDDTWGPPVKPFIYMTEMGVGWAI